MADNEKIYDKLIEVAEDVSALRATYEEGKLHAVESAKKNDDDHKRIFKIIEDKVDRNEVSTMVWLQNNPKSVFLLIVFVAIGISLVGADSRLVRMLVGK